MTDRILANLERQNNGIYNGLVKKNIEFTRTEILDTMDIDEKINLLKEENDRLKVISNANKPPPQVKEKKVQPVAQVANEIKEKPKKIETIMDLDSMNRAFFNDEFDSFEQQFLDCNLKMYYASYKYNSDKDDAPDFSATNLHQNFVQKCMNHAKYFMICFRCWKNVSETKYKYDSYWLMNMNDPLSSVMGDFGDDFEFTEILDKNVFIQEIKKRSEPIKDDYECIRENYVH